jgi:hypothetical protein
MFASHNVTQCASIIVTPQVALLPFTFSHCTRVWPFKAQGLVVSPALQAFVLMNKFLRVRQRIVVILILEMGVLCSVGKQVEEHAEPHWGAEGQKKWTTEVGKRPLMWGVEPTASVGRREDIGCGRTTRYERAPKHIWFVGLSCA